jgi:hypothetical protein
MICLPATICYPTRLAHMKIGRYAIGPPQGSTPRDCARKSSTGAGGSDYRATRTALCEQAGPTMLARIRGAEHENAPTVAAAILAMPANRLPFLKDQALQRSSHARIQDIRMSAIRSRHGLAGSAQHHADTAFRARGAVKIGVLTQSTRRTPYQLGELGPGSRSIHISSRKN